MANSNMDEFKKIRNLNLAELGDNPEAEENTEDAVAGTVTSDDTSEETITEESISEEVAADDEAGSEDEAEQEKKAEPYEPVGQYYIINSDVTEQEIRNFLLGHSYRQIANILIYAIALVIVGYSLIRHTNLLMVFATAVLIFAFLPVTTIFQAKSMKKSNPSFNETFHYVLDEAGCHLRINEQAVDVEWKHFTKLMILKTVVVAYTGKNNGYIMPTKDMGSQKGEIIEFLKEKVYNR